MGKKLYKEDTWAVVTALLLCALSVINAARSLSRAIKSARHRTCHAVFSALWTVTGAVCAFLGIITYLEAPSADEE